MSHSSAPARIRLYVDAGLAAGAVVGLSPAQAHYLRHVMRLRPGDAITLFNGRDGEWRARIDALGRGWCSAALEARTRAQGDAPVRDLWLAFAPIKRARLDFLVEKATELGVSALYPLFTQHTAVTRVNTERLAANAVEAAEQCGRLTVPEVAEPVAIEDLLDRWPAGRRLLVCDETGSAPPVAEVLESERGAGGAQAPWAVLTGPEGGFARSELDALARLPFVTRVGLGPRILRADTAALAALACWQALLGDWRTPSP